MSNASAKILQIHLMSSLRPADHRQSHSLHSAVKLEETGGAEEEREVEKEREEEEEEEGRCKGKGKQLSQVAL